MRRILLALVTVLVAIGLSSWVLAQGMQQESKQLKDRQKAENKALKLKHKYAKDSMSSRDVPKSVRSQMKHQREREQRNLQQKHKDERQDMKDRQRMLKEMQSRQ